MNASVDVAAIAARLTEAQRALLIQHGEMRSSCYTSSGTLVRKCFWNSVGRHPPQPKYQVREALVRRALLERWDDSAGLTPLGLAVRAHLASASHSEQPRG